MMPADSIARKKKSPKNFAKPRQTDLVQGAGGRGGQSAGGEQKSLAASAETRSQTPEKVTRDDEDEAFTQDNDVTIDPNCLPPLAYLGAVQKHSILRELKNTRRSTSKSQATVDNVRRPSRQ